MASARRGDLVTVDVTDLAFGGEGVARAGGYVVFVPGGVPGDRADVRLKEVRPRFARGAIERLERPSALRTEPPCPYFGRCGGCRLQHVRYEAQLEFKQRQVVECLARLGGLADVPMSPIVGAPEIYGYRNKMEFTFAEVDGQPVVGLHEAERYDAILDVERCLLQSDGMNAVLAEVRAFVRERGWSVYRQETEEGLLRFLMLREGRQTGEGMVNLVHGLAGRADGAGPRRPPPGAVPPGHVGRPQREPEEGRGRRGRRGAPGRRQRDHPGAAPGPHVLDLRQLVLPDEHAAGRAPVRDRGATTPG